MPPLPPSPFPTSPLTKIWMFVVNELAESRWLNKVKGSEHWRGGAVSTQPFTLAELPAIRVTPAGGSWDWADECRWNGPFTLEVRIAVPGTRTSDLLDFWYAVTQAIRPTNELMDRLQPLGPYNITPTSPALRPALICDGQAIESYGIITIKTNVKI
jgi:hypothetical protein